MGKLFQQEIVSLRIKIDTEKVDNTAEAIYSLEKRLGYSLAELSAVIDKDCLSDQVSRSETWASLSKYTALLEKERVKLEIIAGVLRRIADEAETYEESILDHELMERRSVADIRMSDLGDIRSIVDEVMSRA